MSREEPELLARVGWNAVTEPGDPAAGVVVEALGAVGAWHWLLAARRTSTREAVRQLRARVRQVPTDPGTSDPGAHDPGTLDPGAHDPDGTASHPHTSATEANRALLSASVSPGVDRIWRVVGRALTRWIPRLDVDPRTVLLAARRIGAAPVVPGDPGWPTRLSDLGATAPLCLWVRGGTDLAATVHRSVAVVGARAASEYGERVAEDLACELALAGVTVVSGGAYGIDAAAHRGALAPHPGDGCARTVALLAGGPDRLTPAGNAALLRRVLDAGGLVVAESPPGRPPSRSRFLLRNRLIAALTQATVVVEAGWRSGALNTAQHAIALLRPVGAVPGPVTSAASAGCHRLLRDGAAVCVTDAAEVLDLLPGVAPASGAPADASTRPKYLPGPRLDRGEPARVGLHRGGPDRVGLDEDGRVGPDGGVPDRAGPEGTGADAAGSTGDRPGRARASTDDRPHSRRARVLDALGRAAAGSGTIAARAGLSVPEVEAELGLLELSGRARRSAGDRWSLPPRGSAR